MSKRVTILAITVILLVVAVGLAKMMVTTAADRRVSSPRIAAEDITLLATPTDLPPTPTETFLPTPELPTPISKTPVLEVWSGAPTAAESQPGYYFTLKFDASVWALTEDETGSPALINRQIPNCKIAPLSGGRGMPRGWEADDQFRDIGTVPYEVITASQNKVVQFINYFGGDGVILTGFQVAIEGQQDECIQMAEVVLATLASVIAPPPTPTLEFTLTPSATP